MDNHQFNTVFFYVEQWIPLTPLYFPSETSSSGCVSSHFLQLRKHLPASLQFALWVFSVTVCQAFEFSNSYSYVQPWFSVTVWHLSWLETRLTISLSNKGQLSFFKRQIVTLVTKCSGLISPGVRFPDSHLSGKVGTTSAGPDDLQMKE